MTYFTTAARTATAITLVAAIPAFAQDSENQDSDGDSVQVLATWTYAPLYEDGWSVENMFNVTDVTGPGDEVIGDVENVIFRNNGEVLGIVAQVGGFWDIGDTHVFVPWDDVSVGDDLSQAQVPVTEEEVDDFDIFGATEGDAMVAESDASDTNVVDDDLVAGESVFKATDLIGDYAYLSDGVQYGYVADLIVQDGRISAVVSDAASYGRSGYYAYPYQYGRGSPRMGPRYQMPYDQSEIDTIESFDYTQLQSRAE
ncbi:MAG TPA: PRC-barrel domain-containing protein [Roseovarius sp.]|uniref:PRC-barrel domain-containing protein n=1 Tax=Marivita sp. TaxID=2003365 RepID=UPI0025BD9F09|nr:PRC-barrel domain-containing protein [Marivita sp.]HKL45643.1 PRC-barrel domain-containing protein [Roseovarius sp.]